MRDHEETELSRVPGSPCGKDGAALSPEPAARRRLLRALAVGGSGGAIASIATWARPEIQSVILPAHADATPGEIPRVSNDCCENAIPIGCGTVITGSTRNATNNDAPDFCDTTLSTAPGVWYSLVGDGSFIELDTCSGTNYDSKIGVFSGSCGDLTCVTGNDDSCGLQSAVGFASTNGVPYLIYVTGFSTARGEFELRVTCIQ
jgi:hypothetical protein